METTLVHARLARLEAENRRTKRLLLALIVVLAAVPCLSLRGEAPDATYRIVYASKFALRDPRTGKLRAELSHQLQPGGWAGITLWDGDGHDRGEFKLWEDGRSQLLMVDGAGNELIRASVSAQGAPTLALGGKALRAP
jgi:hypothetical protein